MNAKSYILLIFICLLSVACVTKLNVSVAVVDKAKLKENVSIMEAINLRYSQIVDFIRSSNYLGRLQVEVVVLTDQLIRESPSIDVASAPLIRSEIIEFSRNAIISFDTLLNYVVVDDANRTILNYQNWISLLYHFRSDLMIELDNGEILQSLNDLEGINRFIEAADVAKSNRITQQYGTFGDPYISYVIHSPDSIWIKSEPNKNKLKTFNSARAVTRFGKSDIAIVMEDVGHFHLKGARVDASETIQAISKSASMTLSLIADSQMLPINLPKLGSSTPSEDSDKGSNALYDAEIAISESKSAKRTFDLQTLSAIDGILLNAKFLSGNSDLPGLIESLKLVVNQYHNSLNTSTKK